MAPTDVDRSFLDRARALGRRGWGHVHPNPMVGCVVVRDGRIVGEGHHAEYGGPHAEVAALDAAGEAARGATVYVSLEPCDHVGKTPPCTDALLAAGVARVVYGAADPGAVSGGGGARLARDGVAVEGPVWPEHEWTAENPAFFHAARHDTPWVALKLAMSLDGGIAEAPGVRTDVTGPEARDWVHGLRTGFDAILVGAATARVDRPSLTVRHAEVGRVAPKRLVLDPRAELPLEGPLFEDLDAAPLHVFTRRDAAEAGLERLEAGGAHVHPVDADDDGRLRLDAILADCTALGIGSLLCEGGGRLAASLLAGGHVGRLHLLVAPRLLGPDAVPAFPAGDLGPHGFRPALPPRTLGRDTLLTLDRIDD